MTSQFLNETRGDSRTWVYEFGSKSYGGNPKFGCYTKTPASDTMCQNLSAHIQISHSNAPKPYPYQPFTRSKWQPISWNEIWWNNHPVINSEAKAMVLPQDLGCYTKTQLLIQCVKTYCTHSDFAFKRPVTKICLKNSQEASDHPVHEMKPDETTTTRVMKFGSKKLWCSPKNLIATLKTSFWDNVW